ncbi:MAG: fatty acid desaturase [Planctomycetota bacterium]
MPLAIRSNASARPSSAALAGAELAALSVPDARRGALALTRDWGVVVAAMAAAVLAPHPAVLVCAWFAVGWAQHALVILGHDAAHRSLLGSAAANRFAGRWLTWGAVGVCFEGYKRLHLPHHRLAGAAEDPEHDVLPRTPYGAPFRSGSPWRASLASLVGGALPEFVAFARFTRAHTLREAAPAVVVNGGVWVAGIATGHLVVPLLWSVSGVTSLFLFSRLRTFGEHVGSDWTHRIAAPTWLRWLSHPHHVDHHWEHHLWPSVPSFRLPEVRATVEGPAVVPLTEMWRARGAEAG